MLFLRRLHSYVSNASPHAVAAAFKRNNHGRASLFVCVGKCLEIDAWVALKPVIINRTFGIIRTVEMGMNMCGSASVGVSAGSDRPKFILPKIGRAHV